LTLKSKLTASKIEWDFVERIEEGEISLYEMYTIGYIQNMPTRSYYLAGVKGNDYGIVSGRTKKEDVMELKALTSDLPGFDAVVDSVAKIKWADETVRPLVTRYNLARYKSTPDSPSTPGAIAFFLKAWARATPVKIVVDGGKEYDLTLGKQVSLVLPADQLRKVCIIAGGTSQCMVVRATACCQQFFQVDQEEKGQSIEITQSNFDKAQFNIARGKSYSK
jgi:hypothetical protein